MWTRVALLSLRSVITVNLDSRVRQTVKQLQCLRRGRRAGQHVKHRPCRQGGRRGVGGISWRPPAYSLFLCKTFIFISVRCIGLFGLNDFSLGRVIFNVILSIANYAESDIVRNNCL